MTRPKNRGGVGGFGGKEGKGKNTCDREHFKTIALSSIPDSENRDMVAVLSVISSHDYDFDTV